jgi:hypothetical protein
VQRLREIEDEIAAHEEALGAAYEHLSEECRARGEFARRWRALAARWSFDAVNELIARHNLYYPAEARLPMDPRTGDFVFVGGAPYRRRPLDADWILERLPAERRRAA